MIALGALHLGTLLNEQKSKELILYALDLGIDLIDTAPLYGSGASESIIGNVVFESKRQVRIATKVGLKIRKKSNLTFGVTTIPLTFRNILDSVTQSLKNLKRDTIDLLMLHAYDDTVPLQETLEALFYLYQNGMIQSFGCSNYNPEQLAKIIRLCKDHSLPPFKAAQCHYNMIERRAEGRFIPLCKTHNVPLFVNRSLARGALCGKYSAFKPLPEQSRAVSSLRIQKWLTTDRLTLLDDLQLLAQKYQLSLTSISLAWILRRHPSAVALIGARDCEQLKECFEAQNVSLHKSLYESIELVINKAPHVSRSPSRYFER